MGFYATNETQPASVPARKRVSLKTHTPDRQLHISGLRSYSPELGRWVNRDPIQERGGVNLLIFVSNDALTHWDYLGQVANEDKVRFVTPSSDGSVGPGDLREIHSASEVAVIKSPYPDTLISGAAFGHGFRHNNRWRMTTGAYNAPSLFWDWITGRRHMTVCQIDVVLAIYVNPRLMGRIDAPPGTIVQVQNHSEDGIMSDDAGSWSTPMFLTPVGPFLAHERGHAEAFWRSRMPEMKRRLASHIGTTVTSWEGTVEATANDVFGNVGILDSEMSANLGEFNWYYEEYRAGRWAPSPSHVVGDIDTAWRRL